MTPPARLAAAIELLALIAQPGPPADQVTSDFFRTRRYIGSKDRRAIADLVYGVVRHRAVLDWWLTRLRATGLEPGRARVLVALALMEGWPMARIATAFDGAPRHPAALQSAERALLRALEGHSLTHPDQPPSVRYELPEWLYGKLAGAFGPQLDRELEALMREAPLDLRVNSLKATRDEARAALAAEGIDAAPTPLSPLGLRLQGRTPIMASKAFRAGLIEIQEEGSQIVAALVGAAPGMRVCDFCAGAGGKTLAIAAAMRNQGRISALDVREGRIARAAQRLTRAGIHNVTRKHLAGHKDPWVKRHKLTFDRVLVDAPCSGSGTWRRNPDAKWRLTPKDVGELLILQREILTSAARLVRPGGRLVYATCSLLPEENEGQAAAFLAANEGFRPLPVTQSWAEVAAGPAPAAGDYLQLTPARNSTDGFFVALFERG